MSKILDQVLGLHGPVVYLIVGFLVFAEDALFVGFVLPGETAAILGGVAASRHNVSLTLMCAVVVLAAVVGDSVGYEIGARYGIRLLIERNLKVTVCGEREQAFDWLGIAAADRKPAAAEALT